jgi:beta-glucanase (GH16 family)
LTGGKGLLAVAMAALLSLACRPSTNPVPLQWELVWQDEFDDSTRIGQVPDPARWRFDIGTDWGNAQLEYDTNRAVNAALDSAGHLAIVARLENYGGRKYTSARLNTRALFEQAHGRFEARIRLPIGQGIWPAFWLLGSDFGTVGWPGCGEIDIMESRGQQPALVLGSLHGPGYSGGGALTGTYTLPGGDFSQDFHVFAIEWDVDGITYSIDGDPYQTLSPREVPAGGRWVFDHPFYIILNVAVGGNFVGPPNAATSFPQTMLVDWVRVYRAGP